SGKHASSWNETRHVRRIGSRTRTLVTGKEKQFVLNNRSPECASELVTLERIPPRRVGVSRIHFAVADEHDSITVESIWPRLHDGTHSPAGMQAVLCGQVTGFCLKFLQRIRKRKRQVQRVERVVVESSIQNVRNSRQ